MAFKAVNSSSSAVKYNAERFSFDEKGDVIEGHLVESVTINKDGDTFQKYVLKTGGDEYQSFLGSAQLDRVLTSLPLGTLVRITYNGKKKIKGGRTMKDFLIETDEESRISVA